MSNKNTAESSEVLAPPPIGSPPVPVDLPASPSAQSILAAVSNNPGVFEDLHKKCKGITLICLIHYI